MAKRVVAIGERFGRLKVIKEVAARGSLRRVECLCDCGVSREVYLSQLIRRHTQSCGCFHRDTVTKHGGTIRGKKLKLHSVWLVMRFRCSNSRDQQYKDYGGRGISVCKEWDDFSVFRDWAISHGYCEGLEIDRRNNNGNYEPGNCRWVTRQQNLRNTRRNVLLTAFGETKTVVEWVEDARCLVSESALRSRLSRKHLSPEEALTLPFRDKRIGMNG